MSRTPSGLRTSIPQSTHYLNAIVNVFWSVLCITPVFLFCYHSMKRSWIYSFALSSMLPYMLPRSILRFIELSSRPVVYRRLHVHLIQNFTQHSPFINRLTRRRAPHHPLVMDRGVLARLERATYERERFHLAMFLFFAQVALYAVWKREAVWAPLFVLLNLLYNIYPILLQQFIRLRLRRLRDRL
jgi:hypothetical protein